MGLTSIPPKKVFFMTTVGQNVVTLLRISFSSEDCPSHEGDTNKKSAPMGGLIFEKKIVAFHT